jgi:hypothetical protein
MRRPLPHRLPSKHSLSLSPLRYCCPPPLRALYPSGRGRPGPTAARHRLAHPVRCDATGPTAARHRLPHLVRCHATGPTAARHRLPHLVRCHATGPTAACHRLPHLVRCHATGPATAYHTPEGHATRPNLPHLPEPLAPCLAPQVPVIATS